METEFFSVRWWVSVVAVGVLINLASAYLKPALEAFFGLLSSTNVKSEIKTLEGELAKLDKYANSEKAILLLGFKSLFALIGIGTLVAILLSAVSPKEEYLPIVSILVWVLMAVAALYLTGLFQKLSEYPASRERMEKRIADLKSKLTS
jgi:hypothetical protein